jgi:glutaminyl-peptide cyclotransferase
MRILLIAPVLAAVACGPTTEAGGIPEYTYEVVHVYPHDRSAFTEGLFYLDGYLYEGTGVEGASSIRKVKLETGEVVQRCDISSAYFGEGIVKWKDRMLELTYKTGVGFIYDFNSFKPCPVPEDDEKHRFHYQTDTGEGWAFTTDGKRLIMDTGSANLYFWDPETLKPIGSVPVTDRGQPVKEINELEWVKGEVFANVWMTDKIARINPSNGHVTGWIDCTGLLSPSDRIEEGPQQTDVLNGIAYDAQHDRLFVTGKRWPKLFEIKLVKKTN